MRTILQRAKSWVIKVGTRTCLDGHGRLNGAILLPLAVQIQKMRAQGKRLVLVSSGAVGMGRELLQVEGLGDTLPTKQALAAMGQVAIMHDYQNLFSMLGIPVAQVLLTRDDVAARERYLNARNTLNALLEHGVLPIINENDSVSTGEIRFGDNDQLAAMVGSIINAEVVVNLTSVPGILIDDPQNPGQEKVLSEVRAVTPELAALDKGTTSQGGTGGLSSKLRAAQMVIRYGGAMVIAGASTPEILTRLQAGEELGTLLAGTESRLNSRQRWLAEAARSQGVVTIDSGAAQALRQGGTSLLAVGVVSCEGDFKAGDLVTVWAPGEDKPLARGLSNYSQSELQAVAGHPTSQIADILGHPGYEEVIHQSDLILL